MSDILSIITLGFYSKPFDKKKYIEENYRLHDVAYVEDNPQIIALKNLTITIAALSAESSYNSALANRRSVAVALLSIFVMLISVLTSCSAAKTAHEDDLSSTRALVEGIRGNDKYRRHFTR